MAKPKPMLQVRAPKNPDDFVTGRTSADADGQPSDADGQPSDADGQPSDADAQTPGVVPAAGRQHPTKMRGLVQRADGGARLRITVYLDPDVGVKLRRHCFENGLQVSDVAAEVVTKFVRKL